MSGTGSPIQTIQGQPLNDEQRQYLDGFFAGLAARGLKFSDVEPAPEPGRKVSLDELIFEERVKRELHPLDAYRQLLENAAHNQPPDKEDIFRFKWNGLFFLTPNKEAFMARLRIPGGVVKTFQLREIARVAQELTSGYVQITTRANIQIRLIQPKDAPEVLRRIQSIGLHTRGAGADNIRNLTANPTAGIDPHELIDVLPFCQELAQIIINDRSFYDLPRKFNIAFDGGGLIGTVEDTNDIGARAVKVGEEILFRIALGGATGHQTFARDVGVLVPPADLNKVIVAIVRVYIANGNRGDRKKARLKHLLDHWPLEKFLAETEKLLGCQLRRTNVGQASRLSSSHPSASDAVDHLASPTPSARAGETPAPAETEKLLGCQLRRTNVGQASRLSSSHPSASDAVDHLASPTPSAGAGETPALHSHLGIYPQKQKGLNYIGVAVPVGQITPKQMLRIAEIADLYGSGEIRLTVWQNFIIPNVPDAYVETVRKTLRRAGFDSQQSHLRGGLVACTGNSYCKFAQTNTKGHALALADYLDKKVTLDAPINIHLTGCPHSCAQHYMGDIGLLGTRVKGEEAYHVFVGGGFGANQGVGRQVFNGISFNDLEPTLEKMLKGYLRRREPGETFGQFTRRHDLNTLQAIFSNNE